MSSSESDYVPNEHEDVDQYGSFSTPSEWVPYQSYPVSLVNQNEILYWVIMLRSSSGTNYVLKRHDDVDQYDLYTIPFKIIWCQSYPESLVNQNEIPIELLC